MPKTCKHEHCNNFVFGGGFCRVHQYLRPDRKNQKKKVHKVPQPINSVSKKQSSLNQLYLKKRKIFLSKHPLCQANLQDCTKLAVDIHHKKGRGKYLLDTETWLSVCRNCHNWIELHPKESKELNLSQSRLT